MHKIRYILFFIIFFLSYIDSMRTSKKNNCDYSAKTNSQLKQHVLYKHNNKRLFKCNVQDCNYKAKTNNNLKQHMLYKHSQEKLFKCNVRNCDYSAKTNSDLKKHIINTHSLNKSNEILKNIKEHENVNYKKDDVDAYLLDEDYESIKALLEECEKFENKTELIQDYEFNKQDLLQSYKNINLYQLEEPKDIKEHENANYKKENADAHLLDEDYESIKALLEEIEKFENKTELIQDYEKIDLQNPEKEIEVVEDINNEENIEFSLFDRDYESILALLEENENLKNTTDLNFDF